MCSNVGTSNRSSHLEVWISCHKVWVFRLLPSIIPNHRLYYCTCDKKVDIKHQNCCWLTSCIDYLFHLKRDRYCDGYPWNMESKQCESEYKSTIPLFIFFDIEIFYLKGQSKLLWLLQINVMFYWFTERWNIT